MMINAILQLCRGRQTPIIQSPRCGDIDAIAESSFCTTLHKHNIYWVWENGVVDGLVKKSNSNHLRYCIFYNLSISNDRGQSLVWCILCSIVFTVFTPSSSREKVWQVNSTSIKQFAIVVSLHVVLPLCRKSICLIWQNVRFALE